MGTLGTPLGQRTLYQGAATHPPADLKYLMEAWEQREKAMRKAADASPEFSSARLRRDAEIAKAIKDD